MERVLGSNPSGTTKSIKMNDFIDEVFVNADAFLNRLCEKLNTSKVIITNIQQITKKEYQKFVK